MVVERSGSPSVAVSAVVAFGRPPSSASHVQTMCGADDLAGEEALGSRPRRTSIVTIVVVRVGVVTIAAVRASSVFSGFGVEEIIARKWCVQAGVQGVVEFSSKPKRACKKFILSWVVPVQLEVC